MSAGIEDIKLSDFTDMYGRADLKAPNYSAAMSWEPLVSTSSTFNNLRLITHLE